ncbi:FecR family protein [Zobellia alginiliquefaciens]|uniref:FecR family protein n=1 Tax=Zobellia alginiliquefaciens TaxID=3032586 RepID=UPI0023E431C6|nr:FecR domain-containing protein [Zobellia alginiliquefaciens]
MTKDEFFILLNKFEKGECSSKEEKLLYEFCEDTQVKNFEGAWNLSDKEQARIRLLKRITDTVEQNKTATSKFSFQFVWRTAAMVVGIIAAVTIYYQRTVVQNDRMDKSDVITLQLQDGSTKIIKEDSTTNVYDREGNIVGQQKGNELVYEESEAIQELIYNTLYVPYGKKFQIQLSDGTIAHLNAGSSLKYPVQFLKGQDRKVYITGETFFEVAKDSAHPFIANARNLDVQVLGTKFNVQAYHEDQVTEVVLVEGAVGLYAADKKTPSKPVVLEPGYKGSFDNQNSQISTTPVITSIYTSWMQGELVFRDMPFENILKKLERHYNVVITNTNDQLAKEKFSARFDAVPIKKVLETLKEYHGIDYQIEGDRVLIN